MIPDPHDSDFYLLSSGRRVYANRGIIGLGGSQANWDVAEGYDGTLSVQQWSAEECRELAVFMLQQWGEFLASVSE